MKILSEINRDETRERVILISKNEDFYINNVRNIKILFVLKNNYFSVFGAKVVHREKSIYKTLINHNKHDILGKNPY